MDGIINAIHCDLERTYNATAYRAINGPTEQDMLSRIVGSRNLGIFDCEATVLIMQKVELLCIIQVEDSIFSTICKGNTPVVKTY